MCVVAARGGVRTVHGDGVVTLTIEFEDAPPELDRSDIQLAAVSASDHAARFFEKYTSSLKGIVA